MGGTTRVASVVGLLALAALGAHAQCTGIGSYKTAEGCCRCKEGYAKPVGMENDDAAPCTACALGYAKDKATGRCGAGRPGTPCGENGVFPLWGCAHPADLTVLGMCSRNAAGESVFPCNCMKDGVAVPCETAWSGEGYTGCYPTGARMYTTFPNEALAGEEFYLTVVGCEHEGDEYLLVRNETACGEQPLDYSGSSCAFSAAGGASAVDNATAADAPAPLDLEAKLEECNGVVALVDLAADARDAPWQGISELSFRRLVAPRGAYKVCAKQRVYPGGPQVWTELASHNSMVNSRDQSFEVLSVGEQGWRLRDDDGTALRSAADGAGDDEYECCDDGLRLGRYCLHYIFVVIAFVLLLGVLVFYRRRCQQLRRQIEWETTANKNFS